jgi:hypothetical protein
MPSRGVDFDDEENGLVQENKPSVKVGSASVLHSPSNDTLKGRE